MKKGLILISCLVAALVLVGCNPKNSMEASLNHKKVMMDSDYQAHAVLKTSKEATYEVQDKKGNSIQGIRTNKNGKANLTFNKLGDYKVVVKSKNGNETKELPIKVTAYSKEINRSTNSIAGLQFKIKKVTYEKVKKSKSSKNDAEDFMSKSGYKGLNDYYYRVVINYEIVNNGDNTFSPGYTTWAPIDDSGKEYTDEGNADAYSYDTVIGESDIRPHTRRSGEMVMISNDKFKINHLKINIDELNNEDGDAYSAGGIISIDGQTDSNATAQAPQSTSQEAEDYDSEDGDYDYEYEYEETDYEEDYDVAEDEYYEE